LAMQYGTALAKNPAPEDLTHLTQDVGRRLHDLGALPDPAASLVLKGPVAKLRNGAADVLGNERETFAGAVLQTVTDRRTALWRDEVRKVNGELFDRGVEAYTWLALEETVKAAQTADLLDGAPHGDQSGRFAEEAVKGQLGKAHDEAASAPFVPLR